MSWLHLDYVVGSPSTPTYYQTLERNYFHVIINGNCIIVMLKKHSKESHASMNEKIFIHNFVVLTEIIDFYIIFRIIIARISFHFRHKNSLIMKLVYAQMTLRIPVISNRVKPWLWKRSWLCRCPKHKMVSTLHHLCCSCIIDTYIFDDKFKWYSQLIRIKWQIGCRFSLG